MKKITALILLISILSAIPTMAVGIPSISINKEVENNMLKKHIVSIKGISDNPDAMIGIVIRDSNGDAIHVDQTVSGSDKTFSFSKVVNIAGEYTVYVNEVNANSKKSESFVIKSQAEYESVIELFNAEGVTADDYTNTLIPENNATLGMDMNYYNSETAKGINGEFIKYKGDFNLGNFNQRFNLATINYLLSGDDVKASEQAVGYYDSELKALTESPTKEILNSIKGISDIEGIGDSNEALENELKLKMYKAIAQKKSADFDSLRKNFEIEGLKTVVENMESADLDLYFEANNDFLGFTDYSALTTKKKGYVIEQIKKNTSLTDLASYQSYYNEIYDDEISEGGNTNVPVSPPINPPIISGGGGGGGGGSDRITPPVKEKEEEKPVVIPAYFTDLGSVPWAENAIKSLYDKNIISGKTATTFCPNDNITRAEFVKLVVGVLDCYDKNATVKFSDVSEKDWYYPYVASAVLKSIISGRADNTFGGNDKITREDMMVILYRGIISTYAMVVKTDITNNIADFDEISDYAKNSVLMLSNLGIVSGKGNNIFAPKAFATRAEASVMLNNLLEAIK